MHCFPDAADEVSHSWQAVAPSIERAGSEGYQLEYEDVPEEERNYINSRILAGDIQQDGGAEEGRS